MVLPAVHIKHIFNNTNIEILEKSSSSTTTATEMAVIHITNVQQFSTISINRPVQQLRVHQVQDFTIHLLHAPAANNIGGGIDSHGSSSAWKPGSIILEDSKNVLFVIPSTSSEDYFWFHVIKDFQWLRRGIRSPNFNVVKNEEGDIAPKHNRDPSEILNEKILSTSTAECNNNYPIADHGNDQLQESDDEEDEL
jgi:hypothetical protein